VVENQTLSQDTRGVVAVEQSLDVFYAIEVLLKFIDSFARGIIIVFHGVANDVVIIQFKKFHKIFT